MTSGRPPSRGYRRRHRRSRSDGHIGRLVIVEAAMRLPAVLVPYPAATDNHQFHNARAFEETGAACLLEQRNATPDALGGLVLGLIENAASRGKMQAALAQWHAPRAAEHIADEMLRAVFKSADNRARKGGGGRDVRDPDSPETASAGQRDLSAA